MLTTMHVTSIRPEKNWITTSCFFIKRRSVKMFSMQLHSYHAVECLFVSSAL